MCSINFIRYFIYLALVLIVSCGDLKGPKYETPKDGGTDSSISASVFPHKSGWADPSVHGKFVIDNGTNLCANTCHGADFNGGSARGCRTCHELYPHTSPEVWNGLLGHGESVIKDGGTQNCVKCHSEDLSGGYDPAAKKSCAKCHVSYPHKLADWASKGHGQFIKQAGDSKECSTMCHRTNVPEELKIKGCADCHPSFPQPHDSGKWGTEEHGKFVATYGGITSSDCVTCHGEDLKGGSSQVACATSECHHSGAGISEWNTAAEHGQLALQGLAKCTACHGADLKGNAIVGGCKACHHDNWADTHEKAWADSSQHGSFGKEPATSCKLCHGDDLNGGASGVSCDTCHGDGYPHPDGWDAKAQHGVAAKGNLAKCKSCHNLKSGDEDECKSCHHNKYPSWKNKDHAVAAKADTSGCNVCHGSNLKGGEVNKSCYSCHNGGWPTITYVYPHSSNWDDQFNHGVYYLIDNKRCETACHGKDLKGGISGVSCVKCHTIYPHKAGWSDAHGDSVTSGGKFNLTVFQNSGTSSCSKCHGGLYTHEKNVYPSNMTPAQLAELSVIKDPDSGDPINLRCYGCHFAYPHVNGKITPTSQPKAWKQVHGSIITPWGKAKDLCAVGSGCHYGKPKITTYETYNDNCAYCHKKKGS